MRFTPIVSAVFLVSIALLAGLAPARATVGFACGADDKAARLSVSGAYGTGLGTGLANFGADIELRLKDAPAEIRKLHLDSSHVSQHWFNGRDLKIMTYWQRPDNEPFAEIILIIDTRRGSAEESPYRGRYTLQINLPPVAPSLEQRSLKTSGAITCGTG
jgi:hypothetical protein